MLRVFILVNIGNYFPFFVKRITLSNDHGDSFT